MERFLDFDFRNHRFKQRKAPKTIETIIGKRNEGVAGSWGRSRMIFPGELYTPQTRDPSILAKA